MSNLTEQIDVVAVQCCHLMSVTNSKKFFRYQKKRFKVDKTISIKHSAIETYYKGPKKGLMREVYEVDGRKFNELWTLLKNYALKSSSISHFFTNSDDIEDDVAEIRLLVFRALRYFGPTPNNLTFSKYFPLVVNNILTNSAKKRFEVSDDSNQDLDDKLAEELNSEPIWFTPKKIKLETRPLKKYHLKSLNTSSLFEEIDSDSEEGDTRSLIGIIPSKTYPDSEFAASVPDELKEPVTMIIGGYKISEVAKILGLKKANLQHQLETFASQFC